MPAWAAVGSWVGVRVEVDVTRGVGVAVGVSEGTGVSEAAGVPVSMINCGVSVTSMIAMGEVSSFWVESAWIVCTSAVALKSGLVAAEVGTAAAAGMLQALNAITISKINGIITL